MKKLKSKTIFFDIGGVLLSNGWGHESRQKAAEKFGLDYPKMNELHYFIVDVFEIGNINLDEYLNLVVFNSPRDFSKEEFKDFMFAQTEELPDFLPWLKEWKKETGASIISLNNESKELNDFRIERFGLHDVFDAFVSSCQVKMRKPDPEIYRFALKIAHQPPENCIYFDDREMLANTARNLGINAVHHRDFNTSKAILENL